MKVRKTNFEEEQKEKEENFAKLTPQERLEIHEFLRQKIWGEKYMKNCFEGQKVVVKKITK